MNTMASSPYASTEETTNACRACRLLLGPCTDQLRDVLRHYVPPSTFPHVIKQKRSNLPRLTAQQMNLILPRGSSYTGNYGDMDISLLYILLRNICGIPPHNNGWGNDPDPTDQSLSANIERIRIARNQCVHSSSPVLSNSDFNTIWSTVRSAVVDIDSFLINGNKFEREVDFLRQETMDPVRDCRYIEELRKQAEEDAETKRIVQGLERKLEENEKDKIENRNTIQKIVELGGFLNLIAAQSLTTTDYSTTLIANFTTADSYRDMCASVAMNIGPLNTTNSSFLYIGSKASLRITLNPSRGYYENLVIFVKTPGENIDVALSDFRHVGNMEYEVRYAFSPRYDSTAFQRQKGCGYKLIRTFVYYSNYSENQLICDFFVYLHNAKSLEDKQNVSTNAEISYTQNGIEKTCPTHFVNWTVRTSFLEMKKTAYFEMMNPTAPIIASDIGVVMSITFKAWIPHYMPLIKVLLKTNSEYFEVAFLRVTNVGATFVTIFGNISFLNVTGCIEKESLQLEFPPHWVNRDYYDSTNVSENDVIEFEAGVFLAKSDEKEMPHSVGISILLNETEAWNTSVIVRTNATKTNDLPMVRIRFDESHSPEINPLCNTFLTLLIDTPSNRTESFNFSLWTQEESGTGDATIVIRKISVKSVDKTIFCFHFNVSYNKTENSTVQNFAMVHMKYINSAKINTSHLINLSIEIYIDPDKIKFCSNHVMFVSIGNLTNKYKLTLKLPEVFNDQHKRLIGQLHVLFDNDNNTCLTLPNKGNLPPLFWTRIQTSWFGINASEFEITLTGKGISCQMHGEKVLKVSFPVSNSTKGFNGDFNFCKLTYDGEMKNTSISRCVYRCLCRSEMECSEVFLFLANNGDVALWNLCDISADNI